jgi:poly(3-hydroxybutyrate) depolymerase
VLLASVIGACSGNTERGKGPAGQSGSNASSGAGGKAAQGGQGGTAAVAGSADGGVSSGGALGGSGGSGFGGANEGGEAPIGSGGMSGGGAGGAAPADPAAVKPSVGCGVEPTQPTGTFVVHTIQTSGTKEPDCAAQLNGQHKCGPWSLEREYHLWLPPGYDKSKPYPLVVQGTGCGGTGKDVYSLSPTSLAADAGVSGSVIRVGLTPAPNGIGHGTNPNQGCYDDKEGDDSVDFVFYETLYDSLKTQLCIDENRVFASGYSSGAWLANELGCKYAGDTHGHAIRGVAVTQGGLPAEPQYVPTCTTQPMVGIWVSQFNDGGQPFDPGKRAVDRALKVNGCTATSYDTASLVDFPIGGGNPDSLCKRIVGCPDDHPLVYCSLSGTAQSNLETIANPAFATFIELLAAP